MPNGEEEKGEEKFGAYRIAYRPSTCAAIKRVRRWARNGKGLGSFLPVRLFAGSLRRTAKWPATRSLTTAIFGKRFSAANSLQKDRNLVIVTRRWMKGALNAPDKKRPHPPHAANQRD
jgi:hypothetical protein